MGSRCGCSSAEGCGCYISGGDDISVSGTGSLADPFELAAILDPHADNALSSSAAGLLAPTLTILGRTTLAAAGDTIPVSGLAVKRYLRVLIYTIDSGVINSTLRFNNDSGNNYARRISENGGADATNVNQSSINIGIGGGGTRPEFIVLDVVNVATEEKLVVGQCNTQETAGAGTAPGKNEIVGKWANTVDDITRVDVVNSGGGDFAIGSEVIVLGHD